MSLAEQMLDTMSVSEDPESSLVDEEPHIVIDESRIAIVPAELKTIAVTGDKDIETVTFDCVRYWDGNDLSTFAIYLNYVLPDMSSGTYIPEEIVTSDGDEFYHFDWKIKNNITQKSGKISFAITAIKTRKEQNGAIFVDKQWSSIPNSDCSIALGLNISNVPSEEESEDILSQMSAILEDLQSNLTELVYSNVVQSSGYDTTKVMSQAAVTLEFEKTNQRIEKNDKRITNIEKGMMAESFETDDSVAYIKDVPTNALPYAAISKIGGMTYRSGNSLRSAPVTEVKSVGANRAALVNGKHNLDNRIDLTVNNGHIEISTAMYEDYFYDKWKPYTTLFLKAGTYNFSLQNRALDYDSELGSFEVDVRDIETGESIVALSSNLERHDNWDFVIDKDKEVYITSYVFNTTEKTITFSFDIMISKGSGRKDFTEPVVHTLPIPAEVQALDGYGEGLNGTYYNYVSWNADGSVTFNKVTKRVELTGKESWDLGSTSDSVTDYNRYICYDFSAPFETTKHCSHFNYLGDDVSAYNPNGEGLASGASGSYNYSVDFAFRKDGNFPTLDSFKAYLAQQYAAGTPVTVEFLDRYTGTTVIDISDLISKDNLIGVDGGGDITMVNEHEYAVPSEIIYQLKGE